MADVRPFKAIYYNKEKVDLKKVIMPPYDIIRDNSRYYESDPHNIIRIDKGSEQPGDNAADNRYTRARLTMDKWLGENILVKGPDRAFYVYSQEYTLPGGKKKKMLGFYAAVRLEEFEKKIVLPHERTHAGPKVDRLELMRATSANTSPILSLYFDGRKIIDAILKKYAAKKDTFLECRDGNGINYRMWAVDDARDAGRITEYLKNAQLFIADGHHRYETAINYRNDMRQKKGITGESPCDYIMMVLISMEHSGISILPTHRMLKSFREADAANNGEVLKYFDVKKMKDAGGLKKAMTRARGDKVLGIAEKDRFILLTLRKSAYLKLLEGAPHITGYYLLSVSILHYLLFEKALRIPENEVLEAIDYTQDIDEAIAAPGRGACRISFIVQPATVDEVKLISLNNEVMPQKSTYFLPKLATGFLINPLE